MPGSPTATRERSEPRPPPRASRTSPADQAPPRRGPAPSPPDSPAARRPAQAGGPPQRAPGGGGWPARPARPRSRETRLEHVGRRESEDVRLRRDPEPLHGIQQPLHGIQQPRAPRADEPARQDESGIPGAATRAGAALAAAAELARVHHRPSRKSTGWATACPGAG